MNKSVLISLKENEKLFSHFMENSYYIKDLNPKSTKICIINNWLFEKVIDLKI